MIHHIAVFVSDRKKPLAFLQGIMAIHLKEVKIIPAEASNVAFFIARRDWNGIIARLISRFYTIRQAMNFRGTNL